MLGSIATNRTHLRGIRGVNKDNRDTVHSRFVKYLLPQIVERPAMQLGTLRLSSPYPVADTRQIFKSNSAFGALGRFDKLFADLVVHIFGKPSFFTRQFFSSAFGRFCTFCLQPFSLPSAPFPDRIDLISGKLFTVRGSGNVGDPHVYPDKIIHIHWIRFVYITGGKQVKISFNQNKITFSPLRFKQGQLSLSCLIRDRLSPFHCPNTDSLFCQLPRQDTIIISKAAGQRKRPQCFAVYLVSIGNFGNSPDSHLGRQIVSCPNVPIEMPMQRKLLKNPGIPCLLADVITGGIGRLQSCKQGLPLYFSWLQFNFRCQFHYVIIIPER